MRIAKIAGLALPIVLLGAGAAGFIYLKTSQPAQTRAELREKVWQVQVLTAEPRSRAPRLTLYGTVIAPREVKLAAPGSAVVGAVQVREGQSVSAGQALVKLDERDFEPQLRQSSADVAELEALIRQQALERDNDQLALIEERQLLNLAKAAVERAERLQKQKLGAESALDQAREALLRQQLALAARQLRVDSHPARLAQLEARLARARASQAQARRDLQRSRIDAPFDGIVSSIHVSAGDRVSSGVVLVTLYAPQDLEIRARIPARYQPEMQAALAAGTQLTASARLADARLIAHLDRLAGAADPSGIDGLFRIEQAARTVRPGNLLELALQRPERDRLIAIPAQAIYGNSRLYLLDSDRLRGVQVETVGQLRDDNGAHQVLVRSEEIDTGDQIVITRLPNAVAGLKVSVQP